MCQMYDLYYNKNRVGMVNISRKGMYYMLMCRFCVQEGHRFRLYCSDGSNCTELGLCVRYGHEFGIERCLPVKVIGTDNLRFYLMLDERQDVFLRVDSDNPFPALDKLLTGRFSVQEGAKGIWVNGYSATI